MNEIKYNEIVNETDVKRCYPPITFLDGVIEFDLFECDTKKKQQQIYQRT